MPNRTRWVVWVLAVCGAVSASALPKGTYESFRVRTEREPRVDIEGWFLPAKEARGTLFVLHGYNNSKDWSLHMQWARDELGWDLVMIDFRNHGKSGRMLGPSTLGYYETDDIKAAVDWADARGLPRPYLIYGRSMGGATGLIYAARDNRIEGVVAISPFKNAELATRQMAEYAVRLVSAEQPGQSKWAGTLRKFASTVAEGAVETYLDQNNPLPGGVRDLLKSVDVPTAVAGRDDLRIWILSGENDSFPPDDQRAILAASKSPTDLKRLVVTPGMNHRSAWAYGGDAAGGIPSSKAFITAFLQESLERPPGGRPPYSAAVRIRDSAVVAILSGAVGGGVVAVLVYAERGRRKRKRAAVLPAPTNE